MSELTSIGRFSAGIAHDLNNILTVIIGFGTLMQMKMTSADPQREKMDQIRQNPTCAACHVLMDPVGYGFMNFDPVGREGHR